MNNASVVADRGARHTGVIAVALAAALVTLLAVLILAKPSRAQDTPLITVEPTEVGFGAVEVGRGDSSLTLQQAISKADSAGHLFVGAAGNNGSNNDTTPSYPAS
jgi:hypothetical protein